MSSVSNENYNIVEQAVFGYYEGHRLLRSSVRLTTNDEYELAALSDLAPGVSISGTESYLSGSQLPGGFYALVRTWLAQEMPRPGCVWSHILLIPSATMSTQVDLTPLLSLFRRPHGYKADDGFSEPLKIEKRPTDIPAPDARLVAAALREAYQSVSIDTSKLDAEKWERAIIAVWSQQWPRLRRKFVFRSASSSYGLPGQSVGRVERGQSVSPQADGWLDSAVADAVSRSITPLKRFLWRYGKDIDAADNAFADLVELHVAEATNGPDAIVERVFARFAKGQAETLKGDLLGLGGRVSLVGIANLSIRSKLLAQGFTYPRPPSG
ncbi:hypothetical protein [Rhizobium sp. BK176]|uniref:GAP1-N1 domain-containing protein n=1 Tax=Rhizobium sp. BK176 TaxID=2587071 RepID=UPI002168887F|nr:hypothetical protein [Rhizobium sp. BK176]MCS4089168.1 hypothetical protein [Rhizobium sp. BK176]